MKITWRYSLVILSLVLLLFCVASGCQPVAEMELEPEAVATVTVEPATPVVIPGAAPDTDTPAGVVEAFYTAYLQPDVRLDFRDSPYLSERLIAAVTAAQESGFVGADPFVLAQQTPAAFRVEMIASDETTARVLLRQFWNVDATDDQSHDLTLDLVRDGERWLIDAIQEGNPMTPDGVVQLFYNWYFREGGEADYGESLYLTPTFVADVDARHVEGDGLDYDPFLRARNWPTSFFVMRNDVEVKGDVATVPVQLSYGRQTEMISVSLVRQPAQWRIAGISGELPDETASASQVVALFSDSYFQRWYAYAEQEGLPSTGLIDLSGFRAQAATFYEESPYLSPDFVRAALQITGDQPEDPYFLAAGVPAMMEVESAWADGDHAEVRVVQRWVEGRESRPLTVMLRQIDGQWRIDGVAVADTGGAVEETTPAAPAHPASTLRAFFTRYLQLGGYAGGGHLNNDMLSPALVESLASEMEHYRTVGIPVGEIDPLLHAVASIVPAGLSVEIGPVTILEENEHYALARVDRLFRNSGISLPLQVMLARDWDNQWRIQQIDAVNPLIAEDEMDDEMWLGVQIAQYYKWALAYGAQPERVSEIIDLLRFEMEAPGGITFCSEEWPAGFAVESVFIEPEGEHAWMVIRSSEPHTVLALTLEKREWYWVVVDQVCGDSPAGRALAFYTHYLGYAGDPWMAQAYSYGDYLTTDLIQRLDTQAEAGVPDPFRPGATEPRWFAASADPAGNNVLVTMTAADGSSDEVQLVFVLVDGRWLISDVEDSSR